MALDDAFEAWSHGTGFVGRCPTCRGWSRFTTLGMPAHDDKTARDLPHLPECGSRSPRSPGPGRSPRR